jgi:Zn finger protein HypA/HybF involved in hydrogenase expression/DNA-directed RNA polymerase subunit RPC12/RpoP
MISGSQRPLAERRQAVALWLTKLSIPAERVFTVLGVKGVEELGDDHLEVLTGLRTALREGDITLDEAFPPIKFDEKSKIASAEKEKKTGSQVVNTNFEEKDDKLINKDIQIPGEPDVAKKAELQKQIDALKNGTQQEPPRTDSPTECRYICQGCDTEHDKLTGKGLCPKCLSDKIIDRKEYYCIDCDKEFPKQKGDKCPTPNCPGKLVKQRKNGK